MCKTRLLVFFEKNKFFTKAYLLFPTSPRIEIDPRESDSRFPENHEKLKIMEISEILKNYLKMITLVPRM